MEQTQGKQGPSLSEAVHEVQGFFPSDATLQDAISRLAAAGFDRADLSVPDADALKAETTPEASAHDAPSHVDQRQVRTMASGMSGSVAGMAAGAVALTAGAAAPLVAAAAGIGALGAAAATTGIGVASDAAGSNARDALGAQGRLVLAARIRDGAKAALAEEAMRTAGATQLRQVTRAEEVVTRGINASGWTGS